MTSLEKSVGYIHTVKYWDTTLECPHSPQEMPIQFHGVSALWDVLMLRTSVLSSRDFKLQCITGMSWHKTPEKILSKRVSEFSLTLVKLWLYPTLKNCMSLHKKCLELPSHLKRVCYPYVLICWESKIIFWYSSMSLLFFCRSQETQSRKKMYLCRGKYHFESFFF